ncbi:hypothetical protein LGT39_01365 [Demequina sp. TTPB684]|uniref:FtsX-like permease family protein n=1 Tax=unclassified Demequina TaxID=2620311 RepID=UPI001CF46AB1|nr:MULTISPECIES: FtsX-like permease family protein [unclassified Demequina]MCB2411496.1 hypothetical protein [Demequina sp. TTPB684]UPU87634.1 hypothetical protein LGT36_010270 [Demequina sp. TMPB413]
MIWQLVREQLRSQRRAAGALFVLVALTVGLSAGAGIASATAQADTTAVNQDGSWPTGTAGAWIPVWVPEPGVDTLSTSLPFKPLTLSEYAEMLAAIRAVDPHAVVHFAVGARTQAEDAAPTIAVARDGDFAKDFFVEGSAPIVGEVALSVPRARELGLSIGDALPVYDDAGGTALTLVVSGLTRTDQGRWSDVPIVSVEDGLRLASVSPTFSYTTASGDPATVVDFTVVWDGDVPAGVAKTLAKASGDDSLLFSDAGPRAATLMLTNSSPWLLLAAAVTAVIAIGAAVASGKDQGRQRASWVGTAKALGAARRDVVGATLLEAVGVGLLAWLAAIAVAWGVNVAALWPRRADAAWILERTAPSVPWWVVLGSALLAVVLALIMAAVPALWAARVPPREALVPNLTIERAVPGHARRLAVYVLVAAAGVLAIGFVQAPVGWTLLFTVTTVGALGAAVETARLVTPLLSQRLVAARAPWAIAAGDAMGARPGAATFPFASTAAVFAVTTGWLTWQAGEGMTGSLWKDWNARALAGVAVLALLALIIAVAVWIGGGRSRVDASVQGALGLGHNARIIASLARLGAPVLAGGVVGAIAAVAGVALLGAAASWGALIWPPQTTSWRMVATTGTSILAMIPGLIVAAGTAGLASSRTADVRVPRS